jgi:hypothetical protein
VETLGKIEANIVRYVAGSRDGTVPMARKTKKAALRQAAPGLSDRVRRWLLPFLMLWLAALHLFGRGIDPNFP